MLGPHPREVGASCFTPVTSNLSKPLDCANLGTSLELGSDINNLNVNLGPHQ